MNSVSASSSLSQGWIIPIGGAEKKIRSPAILKRFVEICGKKDGHIAIIPTASQLPDTGARYVQVFEKLGIAKSDILPIETAEDCHRADYLDILKAASGIFFTGGNQSRLADAICDTPAGEIILDRNKNDGLHIAGTSAGAAFISKHMITSGKKGPSPRTAMTTLREGLGLTPHIIIDQHFRERDRLGRLLFALSYHPGLLGMGVDENTGAFIRPDGIIEVAGSGSVTIVDTSDVIFSAYGEKSRGKPLSLAGIKLHILQKGDLYNSLENVAQIAKPA